MGLRTLGAVLDEIRTGEERGKGKLESRHPRKLGMKEL